MEGEGGGGAVEILITFLLRERMASSYKVKIILTTCVCFKYFLNKANFQGVSQKIKYRQKQFSPLMLSAGFS